MKAKLAKRNMISSPQIPNSASTPTTTLWLRTYVHAVRISPNIHLHPLVIPLTYPLNNFQAKDTPYQPPPTLNSNPLLLPLAVGIIICTHLFRHGGGMGRRVEVRWNRLYHYTSEWVRAGKKELKLERAFIRFVYSLSRHSRPRIYTYT